MKYPDATYRIQLSPDFTFKDLREILDYLEQFQVSTIYAAPFFQSRKGSTHGYDVTDPLKLNEDIGDLEEFRKVKTILRSKQMTWLQDIVPNHMAADFSNKWYRDIMEFGPISQYYHFFDVDWTNKKIMTPFLGDTLEEVLLKNELKVNLKGTGLTIYYYDNFYPLALKSYAQLSLNEEWKTAFKQIEDHENGQVLKKRFLKEISNNSAFKDLVEGAIEEVNSSRVKLRELLEMQYYEPVHWKTTEKRINYRRFFTINDLICLRMEDPKVFHHYHAFIEKMIGKGLIDGLRIDHIDGLFDPLQYLQNLRSLVGDDFYIIIEKILEWDEKLPSHWPVQGTSGYGFLAVVNQLMTDREHADLFTRNYQDINPDLSNYEDLIYQQKLFILKRRMGGEFSNLYRFSLENNLLDQEEASEKYKEALGALLAAFPVYRIYPEEYPLKKKQREIITQAYQKAMRYSSNLRYELETWKDIFLGEAGKEKEKMFYFLQRCQQFTGPLAAKGVEDTSFYIYNRLISHNEVGDSPEIFGLSEEAFHQRMLQRFNNFPLSINATATHDTKRGEDARMRINVLSELGKDWFEKVKEWTGIARTLRKENIPDANEEYFIFQMLIGSFPFNLEPDEDFLERSKAYLQKVLREAKVHSSWAQPKENYETAVETYVRKLLNEQEFLSTFLPFQKRIMAYGVIKSLSQCLLKITTPGIPDIYQGTELWDLSYVDPDNRRPVDYELRKEYLSNITSISQVKLQDEIKHLKASYSSGKIKMYCLFKALEQRHQFSAVFQKGDYLPIEVREPFKNQIVAFARREGEDYFLIVTPLLVTRLFNQNLEPKKEIKKETVVDLPANLPANWEHVYTGARMGIQSSFTIDELFGDFPVALLKNI